MNNYRRGIFSLIAAGIVICLAGCSPRTPQMGEGVSEEMGTKIVEGGVRFSLYEPDAKKVHLVGDFNNWSTIADPLYDYEGSGLWSIVIPLPPGRYEYKFFLDEKKWIADPANPQNVEDGFGGYNSIIIVE